MSFLYPADQTVQLTADFVVTQADATVANGKVITPGPGISITVIGNTVVVTNSGAGGGSAGNTSTYLTQANETSSLPNSSQAQNSSTINVNFGTNTVNWSVVPGSNNQSLVTQSSTVTWAYSNVGYNNNSGGGIVNLTGASPSTQTFDCSSGAYIVNLPAANSCPDKKFGLKKMDNTSNLVYINSSDYLDGVASGTINLVVQNQSFTITSINSGWVIL